MNKMKQKQSELEKARKNIMDKMGITPQELIQELKNKPKRMRVNMFLKEDLYAKFKKVCDDNDISINETTEKLMEGFLSGL